MDLDGTLAEYHGWRGITHIGSPIPKMVERVKQWLKEGLDVRIVTARVGGTEGALRKAAKHRIILWCREHLGRELPITATKDLWMTALWDDRCVQVVPNTGERVDGGV